MIDVEGLTAAELDALVESRERACVRVTTLADGSVLTRDHPRARSRAAAWAGAALAASAFACAERVGEEDGSARAVRRTQASQPATAAEGGRPSVRRALEDGSAARLGRAVFVPTRGGIAPMVDGGFEAPPDGPALDLLSPVSGPDGVAGEESVALGGIGESGSGLAGPVLPPFEVKLE
ncbi:MAG: hypothetical protein R3F35_00850 [Myxococcota bacterium]